MLSLLASATSAAARPAHALQPTPPSRSCLSTAVDIKTVEWCHAAPSNRVAVLPCAHPCCRRVRSNLDCNTEGVTCPAACVCSETGSSSADLALSMPSSDFMRLSDFVGTLEIPSDFVGPLDDGPQVPATSLVRRLQANNMTAPATDDASDPVAALKRLPSDAVGFCALHTDTDADTDVLGLEWQTLAGWPIASWLEYCPPILRCACAHNRSHRLSKLCSRATRVHGLADMKTWSCLGNPPRPQDLHTFPCVGPEHKAVNVVFSGYATLEKALAAATPAAGDACKPSDRTYCDAQVASMVPWQVPTKKEAIAQMTAPGSVWAATCQTCLDPPKQDASMKEAAKHPYSRSHGHPDLNHGLQFLSLGGANGGGLLNVDRFKNFEHDLPKVKAAGFQVKQHLSEP